MPRAGRKPRVRQPPGSAPSGWRKAIASRSGLEEHLHRHPAASRFLELLHGSSRILSIRPRRLRRCNTSLKVAMEMPPRNSFGDLSSAMSIRWLGYYLAAIRRVENACLVRRTLRNERIPPAPEAAQTGAVGDRLCRRGFRSIARHRHSRAAIWLAGKGVRRGITLALASGFFVTLVLAWYHGERGAQRVSGTELLDRRCCWHWWWIPLAVCRRPRASRVVRADAWPDRDAMCACHRAIPEKSIAVLPFENLSATKQRLLCGRHPGRDSDPLIEDRRSEGDLAHIDAALQERAGKSA